MSKKQRKGTSTSKHAPAEAPTAAAHVPDGVRVDLFNADRTPYGTRMVPQADLAFRIFLDGCYWEQSRKLQDGTREYVKVK